MDPENLESILKEFDEITADWIVVEVEEENPEYSDKEMEQSHKTKASAEKLAKEEGGATQKNSDADQKNEERLSCGGEGEGDQASKKDELQKVADANIFYKTDAFHQEEAYENPECKETLVELLGVTAKTIQQYNNKKTKLQNVNDGKHGKLITENAKNISSELQQHLNKVEKQIATGTIMKAQNNDSCCKDIRNKDKACGKEQQKVVVETDKCNVNVNVNVSVNMPEMLHKVMDPIFHTLKTAFLKCTESNPGHTLNCVDEAKALQDYVSCQQIAMKNLIPKDSAAHVEKVNKQAQEKDEKSAQKEMETQF